MKRPILIFSSILIVLFTTVSAFAAAGEEISYLLTYLADSGCTFIRNGDEHDAAKARDHLKLKYKYAKKRILSAEDFIEKIAAKSSFSHKAYQVHCGDTLTPSKQWLEEALADYRSRKMKK